MSVSYSKLARRLSDVTRVHTQQMRKPQSVAEHSFNMAMFANRIADLMKSCPTTGPIDRLYLVNRCLFHDLPEVVTGDIPYTTKRYLSKPTVIAMEEQMLNNEVGLDLCSEKLKEVASWVWGTERLEDHLFSFIDRLEFFLTMVGEVELGNSDVEPLLDRATGICWQMYNTHFSPEVKTLLMLTDEVSMLLAVVNSSSEELNAQA